MGAFKLGRMTLKSLVTKPETICYPAMEPPVRDHRKGQVVSNIEDCILCSLCQRRCPTGAITVDKQAGTWIIDRFACIQCSMCILDCPKHCLSMDPTFPKPTAHKSVDTYSKPELTEAEQAELKRKEEEKAARIKAAKEAKAAREASKSLGEDAGK